MHPSSRIVGFIPTRDAARARKFYEEMLGLEFVSDDQFALVMRSHGQTIRITKAPDFTPARYTILGWEVLDIEAEILALARNGVEFVRVSWIPQDELGIWTTPDGSRVAWFNDPDGNVLSLSQHPSGSKTV